MRAVPEQSLLAGSREPLEQWLAFAEEFLDLGGDGAREKEFPLQEGQASDEPEWEPRPGHEPLGETEEEFALRHDKAEENPEIAAADDEMKAGEEEGAAGTPAPAELGAPQERRPASGLNIRTLSRPLPSRSRTVRPTLVVLHATAGASAQSSVDHLRSVGLSYHYIIARDGRDATWTRESDGSTPVIFRCVADDRHAFHVGSGIPAPSGEGSINKCSIGISLANLQSRGERYTPGQIEVLSELLAHLKSAHPSLRHLTNHAMVQPWNRSDPLGIDASAPARRHGFSLFQPTAAQIREHTPR